MGVFIGPAGWQYRDWQGIAYPHPKPKEFKELGYLADFFNVVEVNGSFYKVPSPDSVKEWIRLVQHKRDFQFCVKLHQQFTHAVYPYAKEHGINMPITEAVYKVIFEGLSPREGVLALMTRGAKSEV